MNLFFLSLCPVQSAKMMCDKHVVKMIVEACQMLWCAYHCTGSQGWESLVPSTLKIYKKSHINHPISIWIRKSPSNFQWTARHAHAISRQYTLRYGRIHACHDMVEWFLTYPPPCDSLDEYASTAVLAEVDYPRECTPPPLAITNRNIIIRKEGHVSLTLSYRNYYIQEKVKFARWTAVSAPYWWRV